MPGRPGRRSKRTPVLVEALCGVLANGGTRTSACAAVHLDRTVFYDWLERFPAFSNAVEQAEGEAERRFVRSIAHAASSGDWRAAAWWLERRRPDDYALKADPTAGATDLARVLAGLFGQPPVSEDQPALEPPRELTDDELAQLKDVSPPGSNGYHSNGHAPVDDA